ncbi:uncharacterized protein EAE98_002574 [Botrytis deweyae]|uniref:Cytochrome P450 n=1 Tax=Botrytis deweyae TaxID=2478750 RepID=A0ABQ7IXK4_9HELO|nr:uncharacterized protein EAE98_002574 [Botrytis deweyae]KAF7936355.1 hypothetical protein EAE98_002574 [Botrytis deweyae]
MCANIWTQLRSFTVAKKVTVAANSLIFFGEELSNNSEFLSAVLDYPEDLMITAEVLRFMPDSLAPLVAPVLMRNHKASKTLVDHLMLVVEDRPKPVDCIEFFIDANSLKNEWSAQKIVQVIMGIWFAVVHQPALSIVYALEDLCEHPEYVGLLRVELAEMLSANEENLDSLPLLDSFLKESSRLHPSDSISVRRKVLQPFTFSDGTCLLPGDVACIPLQAIMRDSTYYSDSLTFNAFRFIDENRTKNLSKFIDTSSTYPLWGLGKHAW